MHRKSSAPRISSHTAVSTLLAALTIACGGDSRRAATDGLAAYSEVILAESDTSFIGEIWGFAALPNGTFVIADRSTGTLRVYDAKGREVSAIGRRGEGPGEWSMGPTVVTLLNDSIALVGDGMFWRAVHIERGEIVWSRQKLSAMSGALTSADGVIYADRYDRTNQSTLLAFRSDADSAVIGGPFPELMAANDLVGSYFSVVAAGALGGDTLAVAIQSSNYLFIGPFPDGPFDSLPMPVVRRRGAMPELLAQVIPSRPDIGEQALYKPSYPIAVHRLNDAGQIAVVHSDNELVNGRMTGQLYLSLIEPRRGRACADIPVDVPTDPLPYVSFRGSTLAVATQFDDSTMTSRTAVRLFELTASTPPRCRIR